MEDTIMRTGLYWCIRTLSSGSHEYQTMPGESEKRCRNHSTRGRGMRTGSCRNCYSPDEGTMTVNPFEVVDSVTASCASCGVLSRDRQISESRCVRERLQMRTGQSALASSAWSGLTMYVGGASIYSNAHIFHHIRLFRYGIWGNRQTHVV